MDIGWIDFSRSDRSKVLNVVHLLSEPGAIDELGIGVLRDAFANYFYPGTSTIQTRAKYFFLIPYIMHDIMHERGTANLYRNIDKAVEELYRREWDCCRILTELYRNEPDKLVGVIGNTQAFEKKWIVRKPSSIYWNGIKTLGFFNAENEMMQKMSLRDCLRQGLALAADRAEHKSNGKRTRSEESDETDDLLVGEQRFRRFWNVDIPHDWMQDLRIELTVHEAEQMRALIEDHHSGSVLNLILRHNIDLDVLKPLTFKYICDSVGSLPETTDELRVKMNLAWKFSRFIYVARICYNRVYSEDHIGVDEWRDVEPQLDEIAGLDIDALMLSTGIRNDRLKRFLMLLKDAYTQHDYAKIVETIKQREVQLKGQGRAKLLHPQADNEYWIGGRLLDYRTSAVKTIINDIYHHV